MPDYLVTRSDSPHPPQIIRRAKSARQAAEKYLTNLLGYKVNGGLGHHATCIPLGDGRFQALRRDERRADIKVMIDMEIVIDVERLTDTQSCTGTAQDTSVSLPE